MNTNNFIAQGIPSYSPVSFSPKGDSKTSTVGKRRFSESEDNFSSTGSSPITSSPSSFPDRETPSSLKKVKQKQTSIRWLDAPGSNRDTPVSDGIEPSYRILRNGIKDSEETYSNTSSCASVEVSELWNDSSLYDRNKDQPFDEDSNKEEPKLSFLKRSTKSGLLKEVATDELAMLFESLKVADIEESLTF
jgi:hypothetical protein